MQRASRTALRGADRLGGLARHVAPAGAALLAVALSPLPGLAAGSAPAGDPLLPPLYRTPIDPPHVLTGNFGESRSGRYHAGLDFSTGGVVGREVMAPLPGYIARVRASGSGYGRSIYLQADDGRLLVLAHLDAFDEPLASYVAAAQDASGEYEQDLWPEAGRFRVTAGDRLAWTGESGAGPPHLHFEIRRGDVAYNPLRAGFALRDVNRPYVGSITLEPLDDASLVQRGAAPFTVAADAQTDTFIVEGRVRAVVVARDRASPGRYRLAPWRAEVAFGGRHVACQFDSARWGGDMADADVVYDRGRAARGNGLVLWSSPAHRPTVIVGDGFGPSSALTVTPGDPARRLTVTATDVAGNTASRSIWIRGPRSGETGPATDRRGGGRALPDDEAFEFTVLPERFVRVSLLNAPEGSHGVRVCGSRATYDDRRWTAVVPFERLLADSAVVALGVDSAGEAWNRTLPMRAATDAGKRWSFAPAGDFEWWMGADGVFEPGLLVETAHPEPRGTQELVPRSKAWELAPSHLPLRESVQMSIALPEGDAGRVGVYRKSGNGWQALGGRFDEATRRVALSTRSLGRYALFADTLAPRVRSVRTADHASKGGYSRWALEARILERGSGVDRDASYLVVNGTRVPTEWDGDRDRLRWRPLKRPAPGAYAYEVVVADDAGNSRKTNGSFVLD